MIKVAIIILNFNGIKNTLECLKSLTSVDKDGFIVKIIVVDNASIDNSVQTINEKYPDVETITNPENYGFAKGNNIGIKKALEGEADFIFILNNDTILDKNCVKKLISASSQNPEYSIFAPKIYFEKGYEFHKDRYKESEKGNVIWYAGGSIDWDNLYGHHIGVDLVDDGKFNEFTQTEFATGAAMFLKSDVIRKTGYLNEDYYLYYEDTDFCMRAIKLGYKILFSPDAIVWHKNAGSSKSGSSLQDYYITRNRLIFGFKYASFRTKIALAKQAIKILMSSNPDQKEAVLDFIRGRRGQR